MQWTNLCIADHCVFGGTRLCHGAIAIQLHVGVDLGIERIYPRKVCPNQFNRRNLFSADGVRHCSG